MRLKTGRITQHQRVFHRRRLRFSLRNDLVKRLRGGSRITQPRLRHRDAALHIERQRLTVLRRRQFRQLGACSGLVALRAVDFSQTEDRIFVLWLTLQHAAVSRFRRVEIATLLRPVRQG